MRFLTPIGEQWIHEGKARYLVFPLIYSELITLPILQDTYWIVLGFVYTPWLSNVEAVDGAGQVNRPFVGPGELQQVLIRGNGGLQYFQFRPQACGTTAPLDTTGTGYYSAVTEERPLYLPIDKYCQVALSTTKVPSAVAGVVQPLVQVPPVVTPYAPIAGTNIDLSVLSGIPGEIFYTLGKSYTDQYYPGAVPNASAAQYVAFDNNPFTPVEDSWAARAGVELHVLQVYSVKPSTFR